MITWTKNKQTGNFDVFGPADELKVGTVTVTSKSGDTQQVEVTRVSKVMVGKFGDNVGKDCVYGYLDGKPVETADAPAPPPPPPTEDEIPF